MKIFIIAHEREFNGASISLFDIMSYLVLNNEVTLFVPYESSIIAEKAKEMGINVIAGSYALWMFHAYSVKGIIKCNIKWYMKNRNTNKKVYKRIAELVMKNEFDIIYTNTRVIDLGARVSLITKIPHIWHFREFGEEDFDLRPIGGYNNHWKMIENGTKMIIANSNAVRNKYRSKIKENIPIRVIYNGIDNEHCYHREFNQNKKMVKFLITGRISTAKGHELVVKAIQTLLDKKYDNFIVYAAGRGSIERIANLKYTTEVRKHFVELGQIDKISDLRKDMDVELMCSKSEAFGRVTIEAMMGCMPVIGSNSGGTVELITDGENGFLFESGDVYSLSSKMELFLESPELIEEMGKKAFDSIGDKYSKEICCKKIEACMSECVKNNVVK